MTCCRRKYTNVLVVFLNCEDDSEMEHLVDYLKLDNMNYCGWYLYCRTRLCKLGEEMKKAFSEYLDTYYYNARSRIKSEVLKASTKHHDSYMPAWNNWLYFLFGSIPYKVWDLGFFDSSFYSKLIEISNNQILEEKKRYTSEELKKMENSNNINQKYMNEARVSLCQKILDDIQVNSYSFFPEEIEDLKKELKV